MPTATPDFTTLHRRRVLTPWAAQGDLAPPVIVRADGACLFDDRDQRYIDASSGLIAVNLGHRHPRVVEAVRQQVDRVAYVPTSWFNDQRAMLADKLIAIAPWPESGRVFFTTGGAEANEDAVRAARTITGRSKVLTAYRSFHGSSMGAATFTGENRRWPSEPLGTPGVCRFFAPFPFHSPFDARDASDDARKGIAHLRAVILAENADEIAAILMEPMVGSNGAIVYPDGYLAQVRSLCDEFGIILIFDEVMTGFGRLGATFAAARFGVTPDIITFAKGVTSAYVPLGGFMLNESLACFFDRNVMWLGHTYSGHPLAMAAGIAALEAYRDEDLFTERRDLERHLSSGLNELKSRHEIIGDVRGVGAFYALEFTRDRATKEPLVPWQGPSQTTMAPLFLGLRKRGVYAFGRYNLLHIAPPLNTPLEIVDELIHALDGAIGDLEATCTSDR